MPQLGAGEPVALTEGVSQVAEGKMTYSVPIPLPPTANDFKPKLALVYSSQNNTVGQMGVGWQVSAGAGAITRCAKTFATEGVQAQKSNPKLTTSDRLCLNGSKLLLRNDFADASNEAYWTGNSEYVTEIESFNLVKTNNNFTAFTVYAKDGTIYHYGGLDSRNATRPSPLNSAVNTVWALAWVEDRYGNNYRYTYSNPQTNELYLTRIDIVLYTPV